MKRAGRWYSWPMPTRARVFALLDNRPDDPTSRLVAIGLQLLIAANVAAVILETVEPIHRGYRGAFVVFDVVGGDEAPPGAGVPFSVILGVGGVGNPAGRPLQSEFIRPRPNA